MGRGDSKRLRVSSYKRNRGNVKALIKWRKSRKRLAEAAANGTAPPIDLKTEAGPSGLQDAAVAGPSTTTVPLPLPFPNDTDQFVCKVEGEEEVEGGKHAKPDFSKNVYYQKPSTALLNPASMLTHEPARLPDGTLMVPLPVLEHMPIKQEIPDVDDKVPFYVDPHDQLQTRAFPPPPAPRPIIMPHEIKGHRVVDLGYLLQWSMDLKLEHYKVCPETDLSVIKEFHVELKSELVFHCNKCGFETVQSTMNPVTSTPILKAFSNWKNAIKRSTWLFVQQMFKMFAIPFKE